MKKNKKKKKDNDAKKHKKDKKSKDKKKEHKNHKEKDAPSPAAAAADEKKTTCDTLANYRYQEHSTLKELPFSVITEYLTKNEIKVEGDYQPRPILEFHQTGVPDNLLQAFKDFEKPTPIQAATWPISLSGRDLIGIAETGSGKTYAFTIPGLVHISSQLRNNNRKDKRPIMLVVSPTRELALQSEEQAKRAGKSLGVRTICVYGGVSKQLQTEALQRGAEIVVATPGRLIDLINDNACDLSNISFLVLDEADRMLDDGFEKDIRTIIGLTPKTRQTLMFSATWPESIRKLAADFLNNPIRVTVGSDDLAASQNVQQIVQVVPNARDKQTKLLELLRKIHNRKNRVLVFALYKKEADRIENVLRNNGYKVVGIHGNKSQAARNQALEQFKNGSHPVMVATDVAARGLDIPDVEYVVNLTFPLTIESYIHRIGRTGRGGKKGTAYTFFSDEDKAHSGELINVLRQANMPVPDELLKYGTTVKKKQHSVYGAFFKDTTGAPSKGTKIIFDDTD